MKLLLVSSWLVAAARAACSVGGDWQAGWNVIWAEHETLGCVVADNDQSNQYDTYDKALQRCQ